MEPRAELVSGAEIGRRLGVTRETIRQWRARPGFPEPLGEVGRTVVWDWATVDAWASRERPARKKVSTEEGFGA